MHRTGLIAAAGCLATLVLASGIEAQSMTNNEVKGIHTPRTAELGRVRGSLLMYAADKIQAVI